ERARRLERLRLRGLGRHRQRGLERQRPRVGLDRAPAIAFTQLQGGAQKLGARHSRALVPGDALVGFDLRRGVGEATVGVEVLAERERLLAAGPRGALPGETIFGVLERPLHLLAPSRNQRLLRVRQVALEALHGLLEVLEPTRALEQLAL